LAEHAGKYTFSGLIIFQNGRIYFDKALGVAILYVADGTQQTALSASAAS
jgi:hypothetical protein